jgi:hypothetical protein
MKVQTAVVAVAMVAGLVSGSCSSGSGSSAGAGGSSGSGGTGGGSSCSSVVACGGSLVGAWTVTSSCLQVTGQLDLSLAGAGCPSAPVTGSLQVTGTWTANADGTYSDHTITTGDEQLTLAPSCLSISSTSVSCDGAASIIQNLGYASLTCTSVAGGGCTCAATVHQTGGLGLVSVAPSTSGNYASTGSVVTISGDAGDTKYSTCVSGNTLTMTPQSTSPTMTGTIVLQKSSGSGTGGTMGTGGATGTGGRGGTGGTTGTGGTGGGGAGGAGGTGGASVVMGPCDIYKSGGTPCVAAHSTIRALFGAYGGKLYQVRNAAGTTRDINALAPGSVADSSAQDTFCAGTTCVITVIYDQSGKGNDLWYQGSGSPVGGADRAASATGESIMVGGQKVYSLFINPSNSYWVDASKSGIATGSQPEGMYMVTSGKHFNSGCCFDYGNSETNRAYDGPGTMDALNFSSITAWGTGAGNGPWVLADLEAGLFSMGSSGKNQNVPTMTNTFITAVLKNNGTTEWQLKGGDATTGSLTTFYKGGLPAGWSPMKKQGAIVLGSGGDCCATNNNLSDGTFYEGCLVSGYPSDATEDAVQANIVAAGYGK